MQIKIPESPVFILLDKQDKPSKGQNQQYRPVHLQAEHYTIRTLTPADVNQPFVEWFNTVEMLSGLNIATPNLTIEKLQKLIQRFNNSDNYFLGIFDGETLLGFYTIDVVKKHKVASITVGIGHKNYLGKNALKATIGPILDHFYQYRDIDKFIARILARNFAMVFNFKNSKRFSLEAELKKECLSPTGERVDILVFASFKPEEDSTLKAIQ